MGIFKFLIFSILIQSSFSEATDSVAMDLDEKIRIAKERCNPAKADDPVLKLSMFPHGQSSQEMDEIYHNTYNHEARLPDRVGYYDGLGFLSKKGTKGEAEFSDSYIKSIILHVENLLRLGYVKYVFYSDMGHSHLLIPADYYHKNIAGVGLSSDQSSALAFKAPGLKTLYHTAEQLKMYESRESLSPLSDYYLQWRFYTRNPVVDLEGNIEILANPHSLYEKINKANTVRSYLPNPSAYKYFSGFYISANKNGCIPFINKEGETSYFDLSFTIPVSDSGDVFYHTEEETKSWPSNWREL